MPKVISRMEHRLHMTYFKPIFMFGKQLSEVNIICEKPGDTLITFWVRILGEYNVWVDYNQRKPLKVAK